MIRRSGPRHTTRSWHTEREWYRKEKREGKKRRRGKGKAVFGFEFTVVGRGES